MRYPDGGGLDAAERARREKVRLAAAYDRPSEAIADHMRAVAALQAGAESPF